MRYKYILLAFFLFPVLSYGQGNLTIFSESGDRFYLVLNGEQQNDLPHTNIRIEDLNQPYYSTRIIFENKRLPEITKNLQVTDMTGVYMDVTYKIQKTAGRVDLNYFSMAPIAPKYVAPKNMYVRRYDRHGKDDRDGRRDRDNDRYRHNEDRRRRDECLPMNASDFAQAKEVVKDGKFSSTMLSTAKGLLAGNCFTTEQVMDLCNVFNFDDSKLDFAKAAYSKTVDPANYFKVANVLSFSSSKQSLNDFIEASKNTNPNNNRREPRYKDPMDNISFAEAKSTIKNASFDETKISTARGIINGNYFTTDQVIELCELFSFDDSKLEVAKAAYLRTLDRNNFYKVGTVLSFSSSKENLNKFIATQQ